MEILIISSLVAVLVVYLYFSRVNRKFRLNNGERRSGRDRRRRFAATKNKMRRSGKDRRVLLNRHISSPAA
jgi:hypothetical protein